MWVGESDFGLSLTATSVESALDQGTELTVAQSAELALHVGDRLNVKPLSTSTGLNSEVSFICSHFL